MWLSDPASDLGSQITGPWGFSAVVVFVVGMVLSSWIKQRRETRSPDAVAPVATQTAETALAEQREMFREIVRQAREDREQSRAELEQERRARIVAERAQGDAERRAEGLLADLATCNERLYECLHDGRGSDD